MLRCSGGTEETMMSEVSRQIPRNRSPTSENNRLARGGRRTTK
jgi:hypothetical protein